MRINAETAVCTSRILLIPYEEHHVITYHQWMESPELQGLTASEPLTLDQEYAMQRSWRVDADKLTFVICQPQVSGTSNGLMAGVDDAPERMIGDVNMFWEQFVAEEATDGEVQKDEVGGVNAKIDVVGELEIMVAADGTRGKGYGRAAVLAFLLYIVSHEEAIVREFEMSLERHGVSRTIQEGGGRIRYLRVRVGEANKLSLGLFGSLGFQTIGGPNVFGEIEARLNLGEELDLLDKIQEWNEKWPDAMGGYEEASYIIDKVRGTNVPG